MTELLKLKVNADVKKAKQEIKGLGDALNGVSKKFNGANKNLNRLSGAFRNLNVDANRSNTTLGKFGKTLDNINFAGAIYGLAQLAQGLGKAIQASMDSIETTNLFNVAMGEMAESSYEAVKAMSEATGLDQTNLMSAIGTYNLLARSMGFSSEQAAILSENTTKLALDLSSLANVPFEQALADLKSGLIGQTETVYKYGIDLTEATLQQEAMRLGIERSVRTMTQGEKMALRYSAMIRQAGLAHGDFAKTIDTPANQLRLLKENFVSLARAIGNVFMPILQVVIPIIRGVVMALTELINAFATFLGFEPAKVENIETGFGGVSDSVSDATDSVEALKKAAKDIAAPFDELNAVNLDTPSAGSGGVDGSFGGGLSDEFGEALKEYDNLMSGISDKAKKIRDTLFEWLGIIRNVNEETGEISFSLEEGGFLDQVRDAIEAEDWGQVGSLIAQKLNEALTMFENWFNWENLGSSISQFVTNFTDLINGFFRNIDWTTIGQIISNGIGIAAQTAILFFEGVDWSAIGKGVATSISTVFRNTDWSVVGKAMASGLNSAVKLAFSFLVNLDFGAIGKSIGQTISSAIQNIDWVTLGATLSELLIGVVEFAITAISSIDLNSLAVALLQLIWGFLLNALSSLPTLLVTLFEGILNGIFNSAELFSPSFWKSKVEEVVTGGFSVVVQQIPEQFDQAKQRVVETFGDVADWFKDNVSEKIGENFENGFEIVSSTASTALEGVKEGWQTAKEWFKTTVLDPVSTDFSTSFDTVKSYITNAWENSKEPWNGVKTWFVENVLDTTKTEFDTAFNTDIYDYVSGAWEKIQKVFNNVKTWITEKVVNPVKQAIKDLCNGIIGVFERAVNFIIKEINKLHWTLPDWLGGKSFGFNFDPISIPRLARGGSLADGQLFQAGEYGKAELIGNYNNQTTVMPLENSGFVEAMYQAVYDAVTSANEAGGGSVIENVLTLDNEVIYRGQQKVQARKGVQLVSPTFSRG